MRFAHVMLRVKDLDKSVDFYTNVLGMTVQKKTDNLEYKYTLAFLGYGDISNHTVLELTYNWVRMSMIMALLLDIYVCK